MTEQQPSPPAPLPCEGEGSAFDERIPPLPRTERGGQGGEGSHDDHAQRLQAALGLTFRAPELLRLALTHRSVLHDWAEAGGVGKPPGQSNERLEFLGDALLGAIAAAYLYDRYPDDDEGTLTAHRVALVRAETLVRWAREISLGDYLYLGQGERPTEGARDRMLAGAFEALVGAIALDRGLRAAKRFLRPRIAREVAAIVAQEEVANPKGRLQELAQERYRRTPVYHLVAAEGPAHARLFRVEVIVDGRVLGTGAGGSKREAEQTAARGALATLTEETNGSEQAEREETEQAMANGIGGTERGRRGDG